MSSSNEFRSTKTYVKVRSTKMVDLLERCSTKLKSVELGELPAAATGYAPQPCTDLFFFSFSSSFPRPFSPRRRHHGHTLHGEAATTAPARSLPSPPARPRARPRPPLARSLRQGWGTAHLHLELANNITEWERAPPRGRKSPHMVQESSVVVRWPRSSPLVPTIAGLTLRPHWPGYGHAGSVSACSGPGSTSARPDAMCSGPARPSRL